MKYLFLLSVTIFLLPSVNISADENLVVARSAINREVLTGFTRARTRLLMSAESAGRISQVNYETGDTIDQSTPFSCIDDTFIDLELRTNKAEAELLKVDKTFFQKETDRYKKLLKKNSSSKSQLDIARRNLDKTSLQLKILKVASDKLKERKRRLCIKPPADWHVVKRHVDNGKWVSIGEPLVEVGDYSHLSVPFALSVAQYHALKQQQKQGLKVILPEHNSEVPAKLIKVSPAFDEQSRKIHLELELSEGLPDRRGGIRVELPLDTPMFTGAVLVPEQALQQRYEQYWLRQPDGKEIAVVYLGKAANVGSGLIRVVSPDVKPGDQFLIPEE
ncbi:MAG: efflux RND transporter periplasmic adaptor subunit [Candidatus Thiodiazotropha taylori]|nr:efflux RND transporter periplasmic adaptor subunit [Candidatus Thiodiazotropha taylori]